MTNHKKYFHTVQFSGISSFYISAPPGIFGNYGGSGILVNEFNDCDACISDSFYLVEDNYPTRSDCRVCYGTGKTSIPSGTIDFSIIDEEVGV